jgi:hypothetical protein
MFDLADLFLVWLLTLAFCWLFTRREVNHLRERIRAQNEEITRLSRIVDSYRNQAAKNVGQRFGEVDWPNFL